jgi:hypothetical protein
MSRTSEMLLRRIQFMKSWKLFTLAFVLLLIVSFYVNGVGTFNDISTIFTITSFLYGVLAAWVIGNLWSRLSSIKDMIAVETGDLESIYKFSSVFGKKYVDRIRNAIDDYLLEAFEYELNDYHLKTEKHFLKIFDVVKTAKAKNPTEEQALYQIFECTKDMTKNRNEIIPIATSRLEPYLWMVMIFLSSTIIYSLFYIKTMDMFSIFFTTLVSSTIVLILLVVRDLNQLTAGEEMMGFEIFERIFDIMGKPRYYPEISFLAERVKPPPKGTPYRLGRLPKGNLKHRDNIVLIKNA